MNPTLFNEAQLEELRSHLEICAVLERGGQGMVPMLEAEYVRFHKRMQELAQRPLPPPPPVAKEKNETKPTA